MSESDSMQGGDGRAAFDQARCPVCGSHFVGQPCPSDRIGQLLADKYRIVSLINVGGMGVVFAARHDVIGRRFAVKVMHPALSQQPEYVERFRAEALAAGSLEHEHIAAVTDFGMTEDGQVFLVMEFLVGEDLGALLGREGRLPVARAVEIARQACQGVAAAHVHGIVHRDLKPENLFLCPRPDGSPMVKVLDFGIAKLPDTGGSDHRTRTGVTLGTANYMSPEQARGEAVDQRSDVHALGAVLYELVAGAQAHPGGSYNEAVFHVQTRAPVPVETLCPGLPDGLAEVIHRALASDLDARFQSAQDLAEALAPYASASGSDEGSSTGSSGAEGRAAGADSAPSPVVPEAGLSEAGLSEAELSEAELSEAGLPEAGFAAKRPSRLGLWLMAVAALGALMWWQASATPANTTESGVETLPTVVGDPHRVFPSKQRGPGGPTTVVPSPDAVALEDGLTPPLPNAIGKPKVSKPKVSKPKVSKPKVSKPKVPSASSAPPSLAPAPIGSAADAAAKPVTKPATNPAARPVTKPEPRTPDQPTRL